MKKLNIKFNRAVFMIIALSLINLAGVFIFLSVFKRSNIDFMTHGILDRLEQNFEDYEKNITRTLESSIEFLANNEKIAEIFLKKNRDDLYLYCFDIFKHLKDKRFISHWYFLNPGEEGTCFLRMHNRDLYGDTIKRHTYLQSVQTGKAAAGQELGKTAFALRVVHPWYYRGKIIGYLELGVEIETFLRDLKKIFTAEVGLLVEKRFFDRSDWASVRSEKNLKDNWNDHDKYLVVNKTTDNPEFICRNIVPDDISGGAKILSIRKNGGVHCMSGILPLTDASGDKVGFIYFMKDIHRIFEKLSDQAFVLMVLIFFFLVILTFFMIFFHKKAEAQLRRYRNDLEKMIGDRTEKLKTEFQARLEAEEKQVKAVKLAERSSKMASVGVMASGIAHEINQPLNAIKISADSALYRNRENPGELDENYISNLRTISEGVDRISEIITKMRNFWILPEDRQTELVDLNKAVDSAMNLMRSQLNSMGIRFIHKSSRSVCTIKGEFIHMEQIIMNLVSNAINAIRSVRKEKKIIRVTTGIASGKVLLRVEDNGPGIPGLTMEELSDPFYSTGKGRDGTGLGLAIVSHYVKKYKGTIAAENAADGGAAFIIEFPLAGK